ncbi:unnamed protein product [Cyclocybe aegerita]|uniref:Uncharacterized protein n=1 Tax=Cyclocybe aegerita TaxID=1973307 RepID=A0A8S0WXD5_CYCAE|nr:unnamed protein product [Cyclocybe aegerita]
MVPNCGDLGTLAARPPPPANWNEVCQPQNSKKKEPAHTNDNMMKLLRAPPLSTGMWASTNSRPPLPYLPPVYTNPPTSLSPVPSYARPLPSYSPTLATRALPNTLSLQLSPSTLPYQGCELLSTNS